MDRRGVRELLLVQQKNILHPKKGEKPFSLSVVCG
jgi:hypothetical protein